MSYEWYIVASPRSRGFGYSGPGDIISGARAWWGLRAYNSASIGDNAARIRRISDNAEQDFVTLADGSIDAASISTFLSSTTGRFVTLYDQTGNGFDITQATSANQPVVNLTGLGSFVTADFTSSSAHTLFNGTSFTQAQPYSLNAVARNDFLALAQVLLGPTAGSPNISFSSDAEDQADMFAGARVARAATDGVWHAINGAFNGASSIMSVEGSGTTGNAGGTALSGINLNLGGVSGFYFNGACVEGGVWPEAFDSSEASAIASNQANFWGY